MHERLREAHGQQRERRQDDQGEPGQAVRPLLARRRGRGVRVRGLLRAQEPHVHVFCRQLGRVRLEVLINDEVFPIRIVKLKTKEELLNFK